MSKRQAKTAAKSSVKTGIKTKTHPHVRAKAKANNKYRLTVAKDKLAVLLRLPKTTIKLIDGMAKADKSKRTTVIYGIIAAHSALSESMKPMLTVNATQ